MSFYLFIPSQIQPSAAPSLTICLFKDQKNVGFYDKVFPKAITGSGKFINAVELKGGPHGPSIR
jgi:hypothetical protein